MWATPPSPPTLCMPGRALPLPPSWCAAPSAVHTGACLHPPACLRRPKPARCAALPASTWHLAAPGGGSSPTFKGEVESLEVGPPHGLHSCGWARDILPCFPCTPRPCWDWTGFESPATAILGHTCPASESSRHRPHWPLAPLLCCAHGAWQRVGPGC